MVLSEVIFAGRPMGASSQNGDGLGASMLSTAGVMKRNAEDSFDGEHVPRRCGPWVRLDNGMTLRARGQYIDEDSDAGSSVGGKTPSDASPSRKAPDNANASQKRTAIKHAEGRHANASGAEGSNASQKLHAPQLVLVFAFDLPSGYN